MLHNLVFEKLGLKTEFSLLINSMLAYTYMYNVRYK